MAFSSMSLHSSQLRSTNSSLFGSKPIAFRASRIHCSTIPMSNWRMALNSAAKSAANACIDEMPNASNKSRASYSMPGKDLRNEAKEGAHFFRNGGARTAKYKYTQYQDSATINGDIIVSMYASMDSNGQ